METILANLSGKVRRETLNGRDYLVASATLIVPGVLEGSEGALYYPPEEVALDPTPWNGMPLVLRHPVRNGQHVSARDPAILDKEGLGYFFRATANGKLAGETWFDILRTESVDRDLPASQKILPRLNAGKPIELSTGLFTSKSKAPVGFVTHNGTPFEGLIARNYRPDHLAILPDQVGACSIRDGCGVLVNEGGEQVANELEEYKQSFLRSLFLSGINAMGLSSLLGNAVPNQVKSTATGRFKPYGAGSGKGDAHEAAQRGSIVLTSRDHELGTSAKTELETTGSNPPGWAVDEDKWERAKGAADKGEYGGDAYWAVVAHIYQRMGGTIKGKTDNAFCPTGEGGGQDNTCGGEGGGGGQVRLKDDASNLGAFAEGVAGYVDQYVHSKAIKANIADLPGVFKGIFSRLTLGTGPLATKMLVAGIKHSPKAVRLLSDITATILGGLAANALTGNEPAETEPAKDNPKKAAAMREAEAKWAELFKLLEDPKERAHFYAALDAMAAVEKEEAETEEEPTENCQITEFGICANCGGEGGTMGPCPGSGKGGKELSPKQTEAVGQALETLKSLTNGPKNEMQVGEWAKNQWFNQSSASSVFKGKGSYKDFSAAVVAAWKQKQTTANQGDTEMDRTAKVAWLTTNCDCWKGKQALLANDKAFTDADIDKLKANADKAKVTEVAANSLLAIAKQHGAPAELTLNTMPAFIKEKMGAKECPEGEALNDVGECVTEVPAKVKVATNSKPTMKEWLASAPPEAQAVWNSAVESEKRERQSLVAKITRNVSDPDRRKAMAEKLLRKPIADLREQLEIMGEIPTGNEEGTVNGMLLPDYSGAAGGGFVSRLTENEQTNVLDLETEREQYDPVYNKKSKRSGSRERDLETADA